MHTALVGTRFLNGEPSALAAGSRQTGDGHALSTFMTRNAAGGFRTAPHIDPMILL